MEHKNLNVRLITILGIIVVYKNQNITYTEKSKILLYGHINVVV